MKLLDVVMEILSLKYHKISFDNFFTSVKLLELLTEKGFVAAGTVRETELMKLVSLWSQIKI